MATETSRAHCNDSDDENDLLLPFPWSSVVSVLDQNERPRVKYTDNCRTFPTFA